jgi:O-antigen ligase
MTVFLNNVQSKFSLADAGLSWIFFFSIVYQKLVPIGFGLMLISLVFKRQKNTKADLISYFSKGPALWFIFYYFLLVIGLFWTENLPFAFSKLENKLAFVLMPVLLFFTVRKWSNVEWKQLLIYSLLFALVMYEILALWRFMVQSETSWQFEFLASRFSIFMHRSYFACYLVIGIVLVFENLRSTFSGFSVFLIFFFSLGVLQTESKAGIVCLIFVFIFQLARVINSKNNKLLWILSSSFLILISVILTTNNPIRARFETMWSSIANSKTKNNNTVESNSARIIMWSTSVDVWNENFLCGVGTGDYDDALTEKNRQYKNFGVASERLNAHNQFLNTGVQLGLLGVVVLLMIFLSAYFNPTKSIWYTLILLVFFINFLVESFLETQAGIILFCTLLLLFYFPNEEKEVSLTV